MKTVSSTRYINHWQFIMGWVSRCVLNSFPPPEHKILRFLSAPSAHATPPLENISISWHLHRHQLWSFQPRAKLTTERQRHDSARAISPVINDMMLEPIVTHWQSGEYIYLVYPRIRSFAPSKILSIRRVRSTFSAPLRMTKSTSLPRICGPSTSKESASFISR